jgi:Tyrosine phosphatase family
VGPRLGGSALFYFLERFVRRLNWLWAVMVLAGGMAAPQGKPVATAPATEKAKETGEKIPSESQVIKDLHSLGVVEGRVTIFRSASPTRDLVKGNAVPGDRTALQQEAAKRMAELSKLGIKTIISLENPDAADDAEAGAKEQRELWINLEKEAAKQAGIAFVSRPVNNSGKGSLETMSDAEALKLIDPIAAEIVADSKGGGVLFHCAAGHDRTGIVAAYIRMKYQQWPVQQAIEEMRRLGHNWVKYSGNGGESSWHEGHLKAIALMLKPGQASATTVPAEYVPAAGR